MRLTHNEMKAPTLFAGDETGCNETFSIIHCS